MRSVLGLLDGYQAEGFKASEIVLLSPQRAGCLAQLLADQPAWKGRLREYSTDPSTTTFSTIHAFKGLESPVVILTDIRSLATSKDFDLLYVGMSRALHRLAILCDDALREPIKKSCLS
jgi:superfamily I DNA/RNA helicase